MQTVHMSEHSRDKLRSALTEWGLPEELAEEASNHKTVVVYPKGSLLFLQGASAEFLFCILNGFVNVFYPLADGNRVLVSLAGPNEMVGSRVFTNEKGQLSQCFEAQARTKVEIALFSRTQLTALMSRLDATTLLSMLNDQQEKATRVMFNWIHFLGLSYRCRLHLVLKDLGRRFGVKETRGTLLIPELGHDDFAEMINCSRPMASKLLNEMTEKGEIARCGRKYILIDMCDDKSIQNGCAQGEARPVATISLPPHRLQRMGTRGGLVELKLGSERCLLRNADARGR